MSKEKTETGKQMQLINVEPENKEEILASAQNYQTALQTRTTALAVEIAEKEKLLELVKEAEIIPEKDGSYKFILDGVTFSITPREFLLQVKFPKDDEE